MKKLGLVLGLLLSVQSVIAQDMSHGSEGGGGGDATEIRVDEIRADILEWIYQGGSKDLSFPKGVTLQDYNAGMKIYLAPQKVGVSFTEEKVVVADKEKTCRGYMDGKKKQYQILCNIERFAATSEADQYRLIHHEYAGIARLEKNEGSSSDYFISNQITEYLEPHTVLKLAIKQNTKKFPEADYTCRKMYDDKFIDNKYRHFDRIEKAVMLGSLIPMAGSGVWAIAFMTVGAPMAAGFTMLGLVPLGVAGGLVYLQIKHKPKGYSNAYKVLELSHLSEEDVRSRKYYNYITGKIKQLNYDNYPKTYSREEVERMYPRSSVNLKTKMDEFISLVNEKRVKKDKSELSYAEVISKFKELNSDDRLCKYKKTIEKGIGKKKQKHIKKIYKLKSMKQIAKMF